MDVSRDDQQAGPVDAVLIRRFLDGDEDAFRALYRRHTPRLRMMVLRLLGFRDADADDVIQETWLAACRTLHTYRGDAKFGTWLTTIGMRNARSRLTLGAETDDDALAALESPAVDGDHIDIERAIARLPDHQRVVLVLHDVEGFTHEEIATHMGVATGTSKATLSRARTALRSYLNGTGAHG
jgi:RNA polymerase sigma factor (sigma-70 family)